MEYSIEWTAVEIKVLSKKRHDEVKVTKVGEYFDDLHQFLQMASEGYKKGYDKMEFNETFE